MSFRLGRKRKNAPVVRDRSRVPAKSLPGASAEYTLYQSMCVNVSYVKFLNSHFKLSASNPVAKRKRLTLATSGGHFGSDPSASPLRTLRCPQASPFLCIRAPRYYLHSHRLIFPQDPGPYSKT